MTLIVGACTNVIDYDISGRPMVPVINALWSTAESNHIVYIAGSEAYTVSTIRDTAVVECYVNGVLACTSDSLWFEASSGVCFQGHRFKADLQPKDSILLDITLGGKHITAAAVVPEKAEMQVDTTTVSIDPSYMFFRKYDIDCTIRDFPGRPSYYRLYSPSVMVEGWQQRQSIVVARHEWSGALIIDDKDPIFKNVSYSFPEELTRDITFVHSGLSNNTHIFSDDEFQDGLYCFHFNMYQGDFTLFYDDDYNINNDPEFDPIIDIQEEIDWFKFRVKLMVGSLSEEEYLYLLAYNAAWASYMDPLSEPVVLPSNINGGIGFFAVENTTEYSVSLKDCKEHNQLK